MSNFQRTRSKVWWGDSPPNIGSPVAQASNWNNGAHQQTPRPAENDWEPQIPQWIGPRVEETPSPPVDNVWARRHSSPSSHKSQDSGFSDSDSSPPTVQQNVKKTEEPKTPENLEENASKCCKHDNQSETPKNEVVGTPKQNRVFDTPIRSVIKTPKDVQNYLQAHCDIGHTSFDIVKCDANGECSKTVYKNSPKQILITPHKNINKNNVVIDKFDAKKKLFENVQNFPEDTEDENENMEYIRLSPSHQIAVNNQPRMRSPITRINCEDSTYFHGRFERNRLNKSLNYKTQRLDEQILDHGPHSLSCVDEYQFEEPPKMKFEGNTAKALCTRKITDSLNLKTPKKSLTRTKQKMQTKPMKYKNNKGFFNFLPKKNDSIKTIYDITRNVDDRVPTLGLPTSQNIDDWVLLGEADEKQNPNLLNVTKSPKGILKTPTKFETSSIVPKTETLEEDVNFCEMKMNAYTSTPKLFTQSNNMHIRKDVSAIKPVNLLNSFNESECEPLNENNNPKNTRITPLIRISNDQPAPVKHWLCDLVGLYEPECTTTLQSKALGVEFNAKVANSSATITGNIRKVQTHGQIIAHQYRQVIKDLRKTNSFDLYHCTSEVSMMAANINEFVFAHSITLKIKPPGETPERWDKIKIALQDNIQKVNDVIEDIKVELNETYPEIDILEKYLKQLLDIFLETARAVLVQQMRTLVSMLEEPPSDMILKSTLISLGHLGALMSPEDDMIISDDEEMNFVTKLPFIECGVPRALLSVIIESNKSSIKALSLRALATICTSSEAVEQLEEAGGMEILSDILSEESNPEPQIKEAVTVLTQITGPWLEGAYKLKYLNKYIEINIKSVTAILTKTSCCQLLLLCAACLVNLVNLIKQKEREQLSLKENDNKHCDVVEMLSRHKTVENLLESVKKRGPNASIFLQEQTATFINVLSSSSKGQLLLANCPATAVALVCFLRVPCSSPTRSARLQAEFRLINQSTEALARLCMLREITTQIIQLEGVTRLVRVIEAQKTQKADVKRSDKILVNCLRALRAVAKNHNDCFKDIDCDVTNMIKPPIMESVKHYSAKQESYV